MFLNVALLHSCSCCATTTLYKGCIVNALDMLYFYSMSKGFGGLPYVWLTAVGKHYMYGWCSKPYQLCIGCCRIFMGWLTTWHRLAATASKLCSASMLYAMVPKNQWQTFQIFKSLPTMAQVLWMIPVCISIYNCIYLYSRFPSNSVHKRPLTPAKLSASVLSCCKVLVCCPHVYFMSTPCLLHVYFMSTSCQASFLCIYCCQCNFCQVPTIQLLQWSGYVYAMESTCVSWCVLWAAECSAHTEAMDSSKDVRVVKYNSFVTGKHSLLCIHDIHMWFCFGFANQAAYFAAMYVHIY